MNDDEIDQQIQKIEKLVSDIGDLFHGSQAEVVINAQLTHNDGMITFINKMDPGQARGTLRAAVRGRLVDALVNLGPDIPEDFEEPAGIVLPPVGGLNG
jgi:hypothetical protein